MSTELDHAADSDFLDEPVDPSPEASLDASVDDEGDVEVRRDGPLSLIVGLSAAGVAVAYLQRAVGGGSTLDWLVLVAMAALAVLHLLTALDARAPLMVIDPRGVRVRRGRTWEGVAWPEIDRVEHAPRETMLRDGRITVVDHTGRELGVRLSLSTRLIGANWHELTDAVLELSEGQVEVDEVSRASVHERTAGHEDPDGPDGPEGPDGPGGGDRLRDTAERPAIREESPTPEPLRAGPKARRAEVRREAVTAPRSEVPAALVGAGAGASETVTMVIDDVRGLDDVAEPVADPVIGPVIRQARQRLALGIDQLAERTRIRPHVIEAIERDDFGPCGGDFYARGHLRTLTRVLGIDAGPLLDSYDERYAHAPIDPRCVFEAELATGSGSIRATRGGLNWSVLVAAVMAVVLAWSIARLVMDGPVPLADRPVLNGSPGKAELSGAHTKNPKVPVTFTAATGGAAVIVRDGTGKVVFDHRLAFMQTAEVDVAPPVRISSSDGGLTVTVDGDDKGALGKVGEQAQNVFVVRR